MAGYSEPSFLLFSMEHMAAIGVLFLSIFLLFISRKRWSVSQKHERLFALSLLVMEVFYHVWMIATGRWGLSDSLPLELCSISLLVAIVLLWTGNKYLYRFYLFCGYRRGHSSDCDSCFRCWISAF